MKKTIEIEEPKQQKHLPDHYIDIMLEKYKPAKTKAGEEYIGNPLEYFTVQQNFMSTDEEWDFVAKYGFEMLGFLCVLRLYMTSYPMECISFLCNDFYFLQRPILPPKQIKTILPN